MTAQTFFKIRHKKSGLFSKGGIYANAAGDNSYWTDRGGKTWDKMSTLRSHITSHMRKYSGGTDMSDWEVIEYQSVPTNVKGIHEIVSPDKIIELLKKQH